MQTRMELLSCLKSIAELKRLRLGCRLPRGGPVLAAVRAGPGEAAASGRRSGPAAACSGPPARAVAPASLAVGVQGRSAKSEPVFIAAFMCSQPPAGGILLLAPVFRGFLQVVGGLQGLFLSCCSRLETVVRPGWPAV